MKSHTTSFNESFVKFLMFIIISPLEIKFIYKFKFILNIVSDSSLICYCHFPQHFHLDVIEIQEKLWSSCRLRGGITQLSEKQSDGGGGGGGRGGGGRGGGGGGGGGQRCSQCVRPLRVIAADKQHHLSCHRQHRNPLRVWIYDFVVVIFYKHTSQVSNVFL